MPRLRNTRTGSVVNVDDATAAQLGQEWESVEADGESTTASKKSTTSRRGKSTSTSDK